MKKSLTYYMCKIDRLMAWILLVSMTIFFVTGYGMTKGVINGEIAVNLHNKLLPIIVAISFMFHAGYATRLAFIRWKIWNILGKTIWIAFFVLLILGFIYLEFICTKPVIETFNEPTPVVVIEEPISEGSDQETTPDEEEDVRVFDKAELADYNGLNGTPPYVAVDGMVYDMTGIFDGGSHYGHKAGEELSDAFYMKHVIKEITKYPVVGEYKP